MNEKTLIESVRCSTRIVFIALTIFGLLCSLIFLIPVCSNALEYDQLCYDTYTKHQETFAYSNIDAHINTCSYCKHVDTYPSFASYLMAVLGNSLGCFIPLVTCLLLGFFIYLLSLSYRLVVTNKRIYGTIWWGIKRVDLPLDCITATARVTITKSVCVSTPSGTIRFAFLNNAKEIYDIIGNLVFHRQSQITQ